MKLVQMPRALLTVEQDDLPALGVHPELIDAVAARCAGDPLAIPSLALLGPRTAGTTAALMVLARRIGAALRDENIRLRDGGGDLGRGRRKLCYLPGSSLRAVLRTVSGRRALELESALFLQDLDDAWTEAGPAESAGATVATAATLTTEDSGTVEGPGSAENPRAAMAANVAEDPLATENLLMGLVALRRRRGLRTFVTADPAALPPVVDAALRAELDTVTADTATLDAATVDGRI